jgi:hypothetical protein
MLAAERLSASPFWSLEIEICDLPFDLAQGGELVEPFVIWCLLFGIFSPVYDPFYVYTRILFAGAS